MREQWMVVDSRSSETLAQLDSGSVGEVGTARLWIHWRGWHNSTLDPSKRLAQPGLSFQHAFPSAYCHKLFS
ncbi:unnamed protein product [Sphagnum troendelagicum]